MRTTLTKSKPATKVAKTNISSRMVVKLDHRTTIVLQNKNLLNVWKEKYPDAKIIQFYKS